MDMFLSAIFLKWSFKVFGSKQGQGLYLSPLFATAIWQCKMFRGQKYTSLQDMDGFLGAVFLTYVPLCKLPLYVPPQQFDNGKGWGVGHKYFCNLWMGSYAQYVLKQTFRFFSQEKKGWSYFFTHSTIQLYLQ